MSRREFLEILRSQLSGQMSQGKAAAHVRYYEDYIQSQVHNGRSEEEVLAELGDPRLIARTLIIPMTEQRFMMSPGIQKKVLEQMIMQTAVPEVRPAGQEVTNWISVPGMEKQL